MSTVRTGADDSSFAADFGGDLTDTSCATGRVPAATLSAAFAGTGLLGFDTLLATSFTVSFVCAVFVAVVFTALPIGLAALVVALPTLALPGVVEAAVDLVALLPAFFVTVATPFAVGFDDLRAGGTVALAAAFSAVVFFVAVDLVPATTFPPLFTVRVVEARVAGLAARVFDALALVLPIFALALVSAALALPLSGWRADWLRVALDTRAEVVRAAVARPDVPRPVFGREAATDPLAVPVFETERFALLALVADGLACFVARGLALDAAREAGVFFKDLDLGGMVGALPGLARGERASAHT